MKMLTRIWLHSSDGMGKVPVLLVETRFQRSTPKSLGEAGGNKVQAGGCRKEPGTVQGQLLAKAQTA